MSGEVTVARWWRYGKDRLYVTAPDGSAVGWCDLIADVAHPEQPEFADQLAAAVVAWRGENAPATVEATVGAAEAEEEAPAVEPEPEPEPEWQDLAGIAPGIQARKQATELREAARRSTTWSG